jgi:hypothetical protein
MSVEIAGQLSDDISRCLDRECPDSVICARFVQRETGRSRQETFRRPHNACAALILDRSQ